LPRSSYAVLEACACQRLHQNRSREISPWTGDCWHRNFVGTPQDGSAWTEEACDKHVIRGGSWSNLPVFVRSAARSGSGLNGGDYDYSSLTGFRVARDLPSQDD
jgi:formylglycine-generating enzyme required for sulfatase activity